MSLATGLTLRFITKIEIAFNPFSKNSSSARELLRRLSSNKMQLTNDKVVFNTSVVPNLKAPLVNLTFSDKSTLELDCANVQIQDLMDQIETRARALQMATLQS